MIERYRLTKELVDQTEAPIRGEKWVADTKLRGFGLRLWASKLGNIDRAYCIRVSDKSGKLHRKTFDPSRAIALGSYYWDYEASASSHFPPTLGELIEDARNWARDEIDRLKGRKTLAEEDAARRKQVLAAVTTATLEQSARALLRNYLRSGLSQAYVDRLHKIFSRYVPIELQHKVVRDITEDEAIATIGAPDLSPGNLKVLRPFVGKIFSISSDLQNHRDVFWLGMRHQRKDSQVIGPLRIPSLEEENETQFESVLAQLENMREYWQQALCLCLYFEFYAPLSQVMSARWDDVFDVTYKSNIRRREWHYSDKRFGREQFNIRTAGLLSRLIQMRTEVPESDFWFPSKHARQVGHIRSIDHAWRHVLHSREMPYSSPRKFRMAYHEYRAANFWRDSSYRAYEPPSDPDHG